MLLQTSWDLIQQTVEEWIDDKGPRLGAALAFYSLLSLAPLVMIAIAVAGAVFGEEAARGELVSQIEGMVGKQGAEAIQTLIMHAQKPGAGIMASLIGIATLLFGASGVFGELQDALNTIWEVRPKAGGGWWGFIQTRLFSFAMVLATGILLLASLVLSTTLEAVATFATGTVPGYEKVGIGLNHLVSFALVTVLFALIFRVVPDVDVAWKDVWVGALLTAMLFTLGKAAISLYLGRAGVASSYGAAGSLVALVVWVYYSAQILFFGAEFTQVYARRFSPVIEPSAHAEKVVGR